VGAADWSSYNYPEAQNGSATHNTKKAHPAEEKESFIQLKMQEQRTADIPVRNHNRTI
jgi:hypothetical protein